MVNRALTTILLFLLSSNVFATTATMPSYSPPVTAPSSNSGHWTFGGASNSPVYGGKVNITGTINVGKPITVPASSRFSANLPKYILGISRTTPWGLIGTAAIGAYYLTQGDGFRITENPDDGMGVPEMGTRTTDRVMMTCSVMPTLHSYSECEAYIEQAFASSAWANDHYAKWGTPAEYSSGAYRVQYIMYRKSNNTYASNYANITFSYQLVTRWTEIPQSYFDEQNTSLPSMGYPSDDFLNDSLKTGPLPIEAPTARPGLYPTSDPYLDPVTNTWVQPAVQIDPMADGMVQVTPVTHPIPGPTSPLPNVPAPAPGDAPDPEPDPNAPPQPASSVNPIFDLCSKFPNLIFCAKLEQDENQPENDTINFDYQITPDFDPFSGGGCPGPISIPGGELSYQPACDAMQMIRPLVIGLAWLMAGYILVGVMKE